MKRLLRALWRRIGQRIESRELLDVRMQLAAARVCCDECHANVARWHRLYTQTAEQLGATQAKLDALAKASATVGGTFAFPLPPPGCGAIGLPPTMGRADVMIARRRHVVYVTCHGDDLDLVGDVQRHLLTFVPARISR